MIRNLFGILLLVLLLILGGCLFSIMAPSFRQAHEHAEAEAPQEVPQEAQRPAVASLTQAAHSSNVGSVEQKREDQPPMTDVPFRSAAQALLESFLLKPFTVLVPSLDLAITNCVEVTNHAPNCLLVRYLLGEQTNEFHTSSEVQVDCGDGLALMSVDQMHQYREQSLLLIEEVKERERQERSQ
jgi:hypothetical protein